MDLFTETDVKRLVKYISSNYDPDFPLILWFDLFCGFGGVAEGYKQVKNNFIVAGVNHDPKAIENNMLNHPNCLHYIEDVRDWGVIWKLESLAKQLKNEFPNAYIGLHASLECTYFSIAKGGESRDEDSRTLGYHLEKYLRLSPDYITIENVKEFLKWGPVYHVSKKIDGITKWKYKKGNRVYWLDNPNCQEYPKFTLPIKEREREDYNKWKKIFIDKGYNYDYRILNAADFGEFTRRVRYFGVFALNNLPIEFPSPTHIAKEKHHLNPKLKIHNAVRDKLNLADHGNSIFGLNKNGKKYTSNTIWRTLGGVKKFIGEKHFISSYYGASKNGQGVYKIDQPLNTITCKDRFAYHYVQYAYGKPVYSSTEEPLQTITTVPKQELVSTSWLFDTQFKNKGSSIHKPCPTIIARQDKKPLYLANALSVGTIDHSLPIVDDCEARRALREFMRKHGIVDIKIRQLYDYELAAAQGFPSDYILDKSSTRSKKFIGNSVSPGQAKANNKALYEALINSELKCAI
ncbi:DNA (cytosine-5)-methyltransferase 1 [Tenacibaculum sp. MAR_2009_124]|uniref:DNA cytosine methyltransferase n=1 Tax=Tenacibaculum sp. MAR_2009_124 TaxID=1250059 RepID=UPI000897A962|nr:DNA cytosine methyltransferase [Tenacibaculum sp. MAR_2009_124]SED10173.1 DNA (cytosine-5)-methyltransferase 1 [Tenacibaculum sp. MAR_2009_124]